MATNQTYEDALQGFLLTHPEDLAKVLALATTKHTEKVAKDEYCHFDVPKLQLQ